VRAKVYGTGRAPTFCGNEEKRENATHKNRCTKHPQKIVLQWFFKNIQQQSAIWYYERREKRGREKERLRYREKENKKQQAVGIFLHFAVLRTTAWTVVMTPPQGRRRSIRYFVFGGLLTISIFVIFNMDSIATTTAATLLLRKRRSASSSSTSDEETEQQGSVLNEEDRKGSMLNRTMNTPSQQTTPPPAVISSNNSSNSSRSKTIAIYIGNDLDDEAQRRKVKELHSYFRHDLYVVTDQEVVEIIRTSADDEDWVLPIQQIVSPSSTASNNVTLTTTKAFSHRCCAQERSIMWLIQNQHVYDYAWVMEDDVLWSNFTDLADFFQSYKNSHDDNDDDAADLLHSNPLMEANSTDNVTEWVWYNELLPPSVITRAQFDPPFHKGVFQFYRISSHFVSALNDWRVHKNNGEWTFFEPLFANLAYFDNNDTTTTTASSSSTNKKLLTTKSFINNSIGYEFYIRFRPCYTFDQVYNNSHNSRGGLFHPVKKDPLSKYCTTTWD
jgi:hypothetical protein